MIRNFHWSHRCVTVHNAVWLGELEEADAGSDERDHRKQLPFATRQTQSTGRKLFLRVWRRPLRRCCATFVRIPMLLRAVLEWVRRVGRRRVRRDPVLWRRSGPSGTEARRIHGEILRRVYAFMQPRCTSSKVMQREKKSGLVDVCRRRGRRRIASCFRAEFAFG